MARRQQDAYNCAADDNDVSLWVEGNSFHQVSFQDAANAVPARNPTRSCEQEDEDEGGNGGGTRGTLLELKIGARGGVSPSDRRRSVRVPDLLCFQS